MNDRFVMIAFSLSRISKICLNIQGFVESCILRWVIRLTLSKIKLNFCILCVVWKITFWLSFLIIILKRKPQSSMIDWAHSNMRKKSLTSIFLAFGNLHSKRHKLSSKSLKCFSNLFICFDFLLCRIYDHCVLCGKTFSNVHKNVLSENMRQLEKEEYTRWRKVSFMKLVAYSFMQMFKDEAESF